MIHRLDRTSKILAWFAIAFGAMSITAPLWFPPAGRPLPVAVDVVYLAMGLASLAAGIYGLKGRRWAFLLLFFTFLIQCVEYYSQSFSISFIGPISLKLGLILKSPARWLNFNVVAIIVCALALHSVFRLRDEANARGMTVNERLGHLGLFPEFEAAMAARDKAEVVAVLLRAQLTPEQAESIAATTLADPTKYGY